MGRHWGESGGRGKGRKRGQGPSLCFSWERGLGLASLSNFSELWRIVAVLRYLIPGPGLGREMVTWSTKAGYRR